MNSSELKKILTRISLASLLAANGIALIGCAGGSESNKETVKTSENKKEAAKTEQEKTEQGKTACSGGSDGTSCG